MVSYQAIDPFIISDGIPRPELYNDLLVGVPLDGSFDLVKTEDIVRVDKELKLSVKL